MLFEAHETRYYYWEVQSKTEIQSAYLQAHEALHKKDVQQTIALTYSVSINDTVFVITIANTVSLALYLV